MHEKGLNLLREYAVTACRHCSSFSFLSPNSSLSIRETDLEVKLQPAIRYLQKLGPQYLPLIFSHARWVLEADPNQGLQVRI